MQTDSWVQPFQNQVWQITRLTTWVLALAVTTAEWGWAAHPVSVSRSLVSVRRQNIEVTIEVFLEDLFLFHELQPDSADFLGREELQRGVELHRAFVIERFVIRDADGRVLRAAAPPVVAAEFPDRGVALAELMSHRLTFDFHIPLDAPPQFLTFEQHFSGADAVLPAEMQLQVRQQGGSEVLNRALVSGAPQTIRLEWSTTLPADVASEQEREHWLQQQSEATLGITSYSSVYSFLYIEEFEIRHEILIPLLTLSESVPLPRADDAFLTVAEQDGVRPAIEDYFVTGNPLTINGRRTEPIVERCDFYGVSFADFAQQAQSRPVAMSSGRVGIILSWPLSVPAADLNLVWDRFSKSVWAIRMTVFEGDVARRVTLSKIANRDSFTWSSERPADTPSLQPLPARLPDRPVWHLPWISVCATAALLGTCLLSSVKRITRAAVTAAAMAIATVGPVWFPAALPIPVGPVPALADDDAASICEQLVQRTYVAFRYRTEQDIYRALAVTVDGELLQDIFLQLIDGLRMQEQGGAMARVTQVEIVDGRRQADAQSAATAERFVWKCRWNVAGNVEHWGHIHHRRNQFTGHFTVAAVEGTWKLIGLDVVDDQQLEYSTKLRTVDNNR